MMRPSLALLIAALVSAFAGCWSPGTYIDTVVVTLTY